SVFGDAAKVVMVDAVPESLAAAYAYLTARWPQKKVVLFDRTFDRVDLDAFDVLIVPSWHLPNKIDDLADVVMSVAAMQEMTEEQVSFYLTFFRSALKNGG